MWCLKRRKKMQCLLLRVVIIQGSEHLASRPEPVVSRNYTCQLQHHREGSAHLLTDERLAN